MIRPGGIGDFIVSLPAIECLKTDYLEVWTHRRTVPLVRFADRVRAIDATGLDLVGVAGPAPEALRGFDEIVSWYGSNRAEFREAVARLPFRFFPALPVESARMHAVDFYLDQVRELTLSTNTPPSNVSHTNPPSTNTPTTPSQSPGPPSCAASANEPSRRGTARRRCTTTTAGG